MAGPLSGAIAVPGDKSISHRALILAALAVGESRIDGLNEGADVGATAAALRQMGARIEQGADGAWRVWGVGVGSLLQPEEPLDCGNSGTTARLLMGLVASHRIRAAFIGDTSLSRRPMARVAAPLRRIGARLSAGHLPLSVEGIVPAMAVRHGLAVPSAQVKSALLLAGLNAAGITEVVEPLPTRDHLERMLPLFGAEVETTERHIRLRGEAVLRPARLGIPGDPSAAAFLAVAALIVPGSAIRIEGVGVNPTRTGLYDVLREMGADLAFERPREVSNEPVADLLVRHCALSGVDVPPALAPRMIDDYPILCVAAAVARGRTRMRGLAELRLKESDRIAAMAPLGARMEGDDLIVDGTDGAKLPGSFSVEAADDHRIAMAYRVAGLRARQPIRVAGMTAAETSFPGFEAALAALAAA